MINKTYYSFGEAIAETNRLLNSDSSLSIDDPTLPVNQYIAIEHVKALEDSAKKDKFWLMKAVYICAKHGLVMPEWVARSYADGYREITSGKERSWNAVYGKPHAKSTHLNSVRKREQKFRVYEQIIHALKKHPELAIDDYLFEQIGKKFCISSATAKANYYKVKDMYEFKQPKGRGRPKKSVISEPAHGQMKIVVPGRS